MFRISSSDSKARSFVRQDFSLYDIWFRTAVSMLVLMRVPFDLCRFDTA